MRKPRNIELLENFKFDTLESQFEVVQRNQSVNQTVAKPTKGKSRKYTYHAVLPLQFIPPVDYMDKLAAKALAKDNCIRIEVGKNHCYDVAVCFCCAEDICINTPNCIKKQRAHEYIENVRRFRR